MQDYIAESENLVMLHDQVWLWGATTALRSSRAGCSNALATQSKDVPDKSLQLHNFSLIPEQASKR